MLTGNKDVDRMILNKLNDEDLLNFCSSSEEAKNLCQKDQDFWKLRIFSRFKNIHPKVFIKSKSDRSWSDYYADIRKIKESNANNYLYTGTKKGRLDYVMIALALGADIHGYYEEALRLASEEGHLEIVKCLVNQGADVHAFDDIALRMASQYGHLNIVKYLTNQGANIHALDNVIQY